MQTAAGRRTGLARGLEGKSGLQGLPSPPPHSTKNGACGASCLCLYGHDSVAWRVRAGAHASGNRLLTRPCPSLRSPYAVAHALLRDTLLRHKRLQDGKALLGLEDASVKMNLAVELLLCMLEYLSTLQPGKNTTEECDAFLVGLYNSLEVDYPDVCVLGGFGKKLRPTLRKVWDEPLVGCDLLGRFWPQYQTLAVLGERVRAALADGSVASLRAEARSALLSAERKRTGNEISHLAVLQDAANQVYLKRKALALPAAAAPPAPPPAPSPRAARPARASAPLTRRARRPRRRRERRRGCACVRRRG